MDTAAALEVTDHVESANQFLSIEEVHLVNGEVWVLTKARDYPFATTLNASAEFDLTQRSTARVEVEVPSEAAVHVFRIDASEQSNATPVSGYVDFHSRLDNVDSVLIYARISPELSEWRESLLESLMTEADNAFGDQFGQETEQILWLFHDTFNNGVAIASEALTLDRVSDTNNQVSDVDEADLVETDGQYIYSITGNSLIITSAATSSVPAAIVSRTELPAGTQRGSFLYNGRLTVITREFQRYDVPPLTQLISKPVTYQWGTRTVVTVFDVANPTNPEIAQQTLVDGEYQAARAVDNNVYVIVNNAGFTPTFSAPRSLRDKTSATGFRFEDRESYLRRLRTQVDNSAPPSVYRRTVTGNGQNNIDRIGWIRGSSEMTSIRRGNVTSILKFDVDSDSSTPVDNLSFRTQKYQSSHVYVTRDSIYISSTETPFAESSDGLWRVRHQNPNTRIHKVDIAGSQMAYKGSGVVEGTIESQFSLDEHDGYLRVATTTNEWSTTDSENHIHVFEDVGNELVIVGTLAGLATGERIYSARFDGDRAWIVTFRQVDPVFGIDLSDPHNPALAGELKIPGYSEHLQLIDENHLLAIGRDATAEGRILGIQVSLFDVSELANPTLLFKRTLSENENTWGHSEALHSHQAFNYLADEGLLLIPYREESDRGTMTLRIDPQTGIDIVGHIISETSQQFLRSVQIEDFLYGIGQRSILVAETAAPDVLVDEITFDSTGQPISHESLLSTFVDGLKGQINVRDYVESNGDRFLQVEFGDFITEATTAIPGAQEFEFVIRNESTGLEILRQLTDQPRLRLTGEHLLPNGNYEVLVRTRSGQFDNPDWTDWITSNAITFGDDEADMISDRQLSELAPILRWSEIPDLVSTRIVDGQEETQFNPIDHFEVWISDRTAGHMVIYDKLVMGTEFDLSSLNPGQYFAWFRGIYEDGTAADWSDRETVDILGKPLEIISDIVTTADRLPTFSWQSLAEQVTYEIEVKRPNGTTAVYTADNIPSAGHDISSALHPGTYILRVRGLLPTGVTTEWAEHQFTILDRPGVNIQSGRIDLIGVDGALAPGAQETVEIWIGNAATGERVFHDSSWTEETVTDFISRFGLSNKVGVYEAWIRLVGETNSKWSHRHTFEVFHDAVDVIEKGALSAGEQQTIEWKPLDMVESYEVFVQKVGQSGAFYRTDGIVGGSHELTRQMPPGKYQYWIRGKLLQGLGFTRWTNAVDVEVTDPAQPELAFGNQTLTWTTSSKAQHHHLWINRIDENGNLLKARIAHFREFTGTGFSTQYLPDGHYSGWVQSFVETSDGLIESQWSDRLNFEVSTVADVIDSIDDHINDVIDLLDGI